MFSLSRESSFYPLSKPFLFLLKSTLARHQELKKGKYKRFGHPLAGMCYIASEALYHSTGGQEVWNVYVMRHNGDTHWFLRRRKDEKVFDLTAEQFDTLPDYTTARRIGFLTKEPSKRAKIILEDLRYAAL